MVERRGPWSREETRSFLTGTAVPLRLACHTRSGGLWMLSLWYRYVEGDGEDEPPGAEFRCATGADADVVGMLRADDRVAFEVSTNRPPYRGVRGRGRATVDPEGGKELLEGLLKRYLGGTDSDLARRLLAPDREEVRLRIAPERLVSWDYSDRMPDAGAGGG